MTKKEMLQILRLLSALESWALAHGRHLPPFLEEEISDGLKSLEAGILGESP